MRLMRFDPDVVRLRKIARAHAAGELSRAEYRQIRTEIIEGFRRVHPSFDHGDDTQRRQRFEPAVELDGADAGSVQTRRLSVALPLLLALLTAVMLLLAAGRALAQEIPAVRARDPNPATSPRLPVAALYVRDLQAFPALGITGPAVDAFLAEALAAARAAGAVAEHGFTRYELAEIGRLLSSLGLNDPAKKTLSPAESRQLVELVQAQKGRRGVSVVELERIAAHLTDFYRAHGLPVATAYLPSQTLTDGRVALAVEPGRLAGVDVRDEGRAPVGLIEHAFEDVRGAAVQAAAVTRRLYLINDLPGVDTQANFTAGEAVGETHLDVTVNPVPRFAGDVTLDNHGTGDTARERLVGTLEWFSPLGRGDRLRFAAVAGLGDGGNRYGLLDYSTPLLGVGTVAHARLANNSFGFDGLPDVSVDGDTRIAELGMSHAFARSRTRSWWLDGSFAVHDLELETVQDQRVRVAALGARWRRVFDTARWVIDAHLGARQGAYDDGPLGPDGFFALRLDGRAWTPVTMLDLEHRLSVRFRAQFTDRRLPDTLAFSLGGARRARGFEASAFTADRGAAVSVDLILADVLLGGLAEPVLFADVAYGERQQLGSGAFVKAEISDIGFGFNMTFVPGLTGELRASVPLASEGVEDDGGEIFWTLRYEP